MNCFRRIRFIGLMFAAWHQKESCTAANVMPTCWHSRAVYIMWVESSECTKFGGKAVFYFCLFTG